MKVLQVHENISDVTFQSTSTKVNPKTWWQQYYFLFFNLHFPKKVPLRLKTSVKGVLAKMQQNKKKKLRLTIKSYGNILKNSYNVSSHSYNNDSEKHDRKAFICDSHIKQVYNLKRKKMLVSSTTQVKRRNNIKKDIYKKYTRILHRSLSIPVFGHQVPQFVCLSLLARVMQVDNVSVEDLTWQQPHGQTRGQC